MFSVTLFCRVWTYPGLPDDSCERLEVIIPANAAAEAVRTLGGERKISEKQKKIQFTMRLNIDSKVSIQTKASVDETVYFLSSSQAARLHLSPLFQKELQNRLS